SVLLRCAKVPVDSAKPIPSVKHHTCNLIAGGPTEPARIEVIEVAIAVTGTTVTGTPACIQRSLIRAVWGVNVQSCRRPVLDIDLRRAAANIRMPLNRVVLKRLVVERVRVSLVDLELPSA